MIDATLRRRRGADGSRVQLFSLDELALEIPGRVAFEPQDPRPSLEDVVVGRERLRLVAGLPPAERHVLLRTEVDGAPASVVAEELGVRVSRVWRLASTGAIRLRRRAR